MDLFGTQTPRTVFAVLDAHWQLQEAENERALTQAWLTARLSLSDPKKFPKLSDVTGRNKPPPKQTDEELLASVRALKQMFGDVGNA